MYCPKCFNNSLHINSRGVMHIVVNGKQMDAGRFLYNFENEAVFNSDLNSKLEDFFKWYTNFKNIDSITKVELSTSDVSCENKCIIPLSTRFSVINEGVPKTILIKLITPLAAKYNLKVELID